MTLTIEPRRDLKLPTDLAGIVPDWTRERTLAEIERLAIWHGNRQYPLAELFEVAGDPRDGDIELSGDFSAAHHIGAQMTTGSICVIGSAGQFVGAEMSGGNIRVDGDAGDWAGVQIGGGRIQIGGSAGDSLGAAFPGSHRGMRGGEIFVEGGAGHEVGRAMRRGFIAVGGSVGESLGKDMLAGTILALGPCGLGVGHQMRRGTIGLLGDPVGSPPNFSPLTFRRGATHCPPFMRVLLSYLDCAGFSAGADLIDARLTIFHGDLLQLGKGEILARL